MTRTPVNRTAARLAFSLALACSFPAIAEDDISKVMKRPRFSESPRSRG